MVMEEKRSRSSSIASLGWLQMEHLRRLPSSCPAG